MTASGQLPPRGPARACGPSDRGITTLAPLLWPLFGRVGDDLEDQVPNTAGSERGRVLANACQVTEVHDARPIVG